MRATADDLSAIAELEEECFADPWSLNLLSSIQQNERYLILTTPSNQDGLAGYLVGTYLSEEAELERIGVQPHLRGQGFGKRLLDEAISYWKSVGVERIFLEVRVSNRPAVNLYISAGFEAISIRKNYYDDGEDAQIFCLKV